METLPFNHLTDRIAIPCVKCYEYVEVRGLQKHREMHRAWKILHCNSDTAPKTLKQLLKKRRQILNSALLRLEPGSPLPAKVLQRIDWAFEFVRNEISNSAGSDVNDNVAIKQPTPLSVSRSSDESKHNQPNAKSVNLMAEGVSEKLKFCGQSIGVCHHSNSKWRTNDEDRYFYTESSVCNLDHSFFGLFDGYSGSTAAEKCSNMFYSFLRDELMLDNDTLRSEEMNEAGLANREDFVKQKLRNSFLKMDSYLLTGKSESSKIRWSGTSATICYIEQSTLYVANSGNVKALFVKCDGSAISLVEDHTLKNKKERDRILKAKGSVSFSPRTSAVNGLYASTRGLGNHGDPLLKTTMVSNPSITVSKIDPSDQFIVLFTAGISNVFNDEEVMFLLEDIMPDASEIDNLREHLVRKKSLESGEMNSAIPKMSEEPDTESIEIADEEDQLIDFISCEGETAAQSSKSTESNGIRENDRVVSFEQKGYELDIPNRKARLKNESKPCFLARALVERLVYSAILADTRENTSAMVVLLHGCPINLYLLPSVKRKSLFLRELTKSEIDNEKETEVGNEGEAVLDKNIDE